MRLKGTRTIHEPVEIDVSNSDLFEAVQTATWAKLGPKPGDYINTAGVWESWEDTGHGSGLTTTHRKATDAEVAVDKALKVVQKTLTGHR